MGSSIDKDVRAVMEYSEGKLLDISYMYNISPEYIIARPSEFMRANEALRLALKKVKFFKVAEAVRKQAEGEGSCNTLFSGAMSDSMID
ncbi:hypothetical protein JCGZ_26710 [Jatropha curcas]|uniref:NADP-dependent oxidoreductase domain-containing protein n=1 Tax=Jatropha curcas TaxID=180498 RepID=A0A067JN97_JATCU|nr:hypothetical protein JCGZ_26710 [Jatropha curcas]